MDKTFSGSASAMQSPKTLPPPDTLSESTVLSKAVVRAADCLKLPNELVGRILGISAASVSRMKGGSYTLSPNSKPFELALYLVRLFRSLAAMTSGDDAAAQSWLRTPNILLGRKP